MKQPLTTLKCMDKDCGHEVTSHRIMDGLNCEKCGGPTWTYPTNNIYPIVRCKRDNHRHSFLVREGETFENHCPYCGASLTAIQNVSVEETFNLNFIHIEQALMPRPTLSIHAVTDYLKELEALLLHNAIPLPSLHEDNLPTRLEGSD